ncbi:hypothetical protein CYLTODRAFT_425004 [Cylindrobasidium torrendii FP15055 ss-10]|uniref:Uncharacterized protein n=1 Tax=Cylindrobasidium torrendii FP15055 ss-10 TaxID=1314674 RepID=A0A0D7B3F0_9AGAR|nr:hypothetical protein CYLTODRAFT_425004 [Cylindrobasidium torrendii FP15055 ss-10]
MSTIYTEDCISFSPLFGTTLFSKLIDPVDLHDARTHEAVAGMDVGEMNEKMGHPINFLHLASERIHQAFEYSEMAFLPPPHIIALLRELYLHNKNCSLSDRRRFDEIPELQQDCEYVLNILPAFRDDIFLKHPITGTVAIHKFPYGEMPRFRLRTAHSSLVSVAAYRHTAHWSSMDCDGDPIHALGQLRQAIIWPPLPSSTPSAKKAIRCPTAPCNGLY